MKRRKQDYCGILGRRVVIYVKRKSGIGKDCRLAAALLPASDFAVSRSTSLGDFSQAEFFVWLRMMN